MKLFKYSFLNIFYSLSVVIISSLFSQNAEGKDLELQVGIVQRFGDELTDQITIVSPKNDALIVNFLDSKDKNKTLKSDKVILNITASSLDTPLIQENLVLGDYSTFETAENSAKNWQKLGIEVEITQPARWQVWAKRDTYNTPLLKRLLLHSLKNKGYDQPYLDTSLVKEKRLVSLLINDQIYPVTNLSITNETNLLQVSEGEKETFNLYQGKLKVSPNSYGDFTLINLVSLEAYLRGVVPHEIGQNAPKNAVEAQTIIARTYALRNTRRFLADDYQICATTHCQVYFGVNDANPIADQAIASTKGLVLTYNNELVDALYSSTTGGITANFSDTWNGEDRPYLTSLIDSPLNLWDLNQKPLDSEENFRDFISLNKGFNETGRSVFRWNRKAKIEDLTKDLQLYLTNRKHPKANFTTIKKMAIAKRSPSGRILKLNVETNLGLIELEKNEVRSAFKPPISTLFYLEPFYTKDQKLAGYSFIGGGFGHGVGLSQFGSYNLAKIGYSAEKILSFYYPNTIIKPLDDQIVFWKNDE